MVESRNRDASWWAALKVAGIFLVASALWIVGSDAVVAGLAPTQEMLDAIQTYKGLAYTAVMSLLVFLVVKHSFRREDRVWLALRESEERYRSFVATSAEGIWCYKMEPPMPIELPAEEQIQWALDHGRVEECNDEYARLYGYSSAAEMVGLRFIDIVDPNEAIARDFLRLWLEGGYAFTAYEGAQLSRSGEEVWIHGSGVSVLEDGHVIRVWGTSIDITDRKRTELALEASEAKCRRLVESLDREYLIFSHGTDGVFTYMSPSIESVLGYTQDEYAKHYGDTFTDSPVNTAAVRHSEASIRGERQSPYEIEVRHKDGSTRRMNVIEIPLLDEDGNVSAVEGIARDIAEQKEAEKALRASEGRYRSLFEAANDAIFVMEGDRFVECNSRTLDMFGCTEEQILRETPVRFSPSQQPDGTDSRERAIELVEAARAGRPQFFEWQHCRCDGSLFDAEVSLSRFELGGEYQLFAVVRDITERKRAEEALRDSETRLHAIFDHHYQFTGLLDPKGRLLAANRTALGFVDAEETEVVGRYLWEGPWWERSQELELRSAIERAAGGEFVRFETTHPSVSGKVRFVDFSLTPVRDDVGDVVYIVPEGRDITDIKQTEQALRESRDQLEQRVQERTAQLEVRTRELEEANLRLQDVDRLKSMFIASMSHELRTPLNSIIGFTGIVLQGLSGELTDKQRDQLTRSYGSAKHLLALISDVIDISKIEAGRIDVFPTEFDLDEVVNEAVETVRPDAARKGLSLSVDLPAGVGLHLDRRRLLQCLLNYLSNAVKYSEEGSVTLSARETDGDVEIRVSDTGIGISEEDLPRVFEAFERLDSRLRVQAGGTGLGLYLTKKIVTELLGGAVSVHSKLGEGSQFTLRVARETG